jgi:hypothetical protein
MIQLIAPLFEDAAALRAHLDACERAPDDALESRAGALAQAAEPHFGRIVRVTRAAIHACRALGDQRALALLCRMEANQRVVAQGLLGLLQPQRGSPGTLRRRLSVVSVTVRTALEAQERIILPLLLRLMGTEATPAPAGAELAS